MSNFEDTIDDIENWFLSNPEKVSLVVGLIIEMRHLIEKTDEINRRRLIDLKNIPKQQFDNPKCKTKNWKNFMHKTETGGRQYLMINKDKLQCPLSIKIKKHRD